MAYLKRYRALGSDAVMTPQTQQEYQAATLAELRAINTRTAAAVKKEELQKWIQIGVTAAIPVFGAIWSIIAKHLRKA